MFKKKVTKEEFDYFLNKIGFKISGFMVLDEEVRLNNVSIRNNKTIVDINKKLDAILNHFNLEYYEEEKKEIGLREKKLCSKPFNDLEIGRVIFQTPYPEQPKRKRGRPKGSKTKKK